MDNDDASAGDWGVLILCCAVLIAFLLGVADDMNNFTPGPWIAFKPEGSNGYWYVGPPDRDLLTYWAAYPEHTEADTRLIAAAPELYEALRSLVEFTYPADSTDEDGYEPPEQVQRARAALAKVTT